MKFRNDPWKYTPRFGGFCTYGVAYELGPADGDEYAGERWQWNKDFLGPPCGVDDGWSVINGKLYCNIWDSYRLGFENDFDNYIATASERWTKWFGSLRAGPFNTQCFGAGELKNWCIDEPQFKGCELIARERNSTFTTTSTTKSTQTTTAFHHKPHTPHSRDISGTTLAIIIITLALISIAFIVISFKYYKSKVTFDRA